MATQTSEYAVSIGSPTGEEVTLSVIECSPPEAYRKTPIVCVPGLWATACSLRDLVLRFSQSSGRRVIALSMRGHGKSSRSAGSLYTVSEAAYDVSKALRVLALESAVLLGHGVGAMVATRVATLEPERVAGLILCSGVRKLKATANWGGDHRPTCTLDTLAGRIAASKSGADDPAAANDALWKAVAELTSAREGVAEASSEHSSLDDIRLSEPAALRSMLSSSLVSEVTGEAVAAFTGRTLLLWGTDDVFSTLAEQLELLRLLKPRAELKQIDGGGHSLLWDPKRVEAVSAAVKEFVLSLDAADAGPRRSKSTAAALQAYGDAVARTLQKVDSQPSEAPPQTLKQLLTAAAGSLLPPPPPPNKGDRSISDVRAAVKRMSLAQLQGVVAKLDLKLPPDAPHDKLCEALMASAPFVRAMRTQPKEEAARAAAVADERRRDFIETTHATVHKEWARRDAGRAPFETRMPPAEAVRDRARGERATLSDRNLRKLVETESLEDLVADWHEWLSGFEQRSDAMASFKTEVAKARSTMARSST